MSKSGVVEKKYDHCDDELSRTCYWYNMQFGITGMYYSPVMLSKCSDEIRIAMKAEQERKVDRFKSMDCKPDCNRCRFYDENKCSFREELANNELTSKISLDNS